MSLRPPIRATFRARWRFVILGLLLLAAAAGAGSSHAGTGDYPSPLYLSGTRSTLLGASNMFVASPGPGQPATALALAASTPAGAGLSGSYSYAYTVVDAGGETAVSNPTVANPSLTVAGKAITVTGLPTGITVRLYRAKGGLFTLVKELPANSSSSYTDELDDATAATKPVLPQAQNRIPLSVPVTQVGYQDFSPGIYAPASAATALAGAASTIPNGKGWIADGSGSVSFPTGAWTFQIKLKQNTASGVARLVVGMWKVKVSGGVISSPTLLVDPTCATAPCGENTTSFNQSSNQPKTITHMVTVNGFTLASDEHLYVQFWRHQTTGQTTGSATNTVATLYGYDGTTQITHPAANGFPNVPTLGNVAARINTTPTLSATFSDPDAGDTGTLSFRLCTTNDCSTLYPGGTGSASGIANGANGTWTPPTLPNGTYYWQARAQDNVAGNPPSDWSTVARFTVDTVPPNVPTLSAPAAAVRIASPQLTASFSDVDPADSGTLSFQLCSDATCTNVVASNTTASLANPASATWTPSVPDGTYRWRVRAQDAAGNLSTDWSSIRTFTLDTTPPSATTLDSPGDGLVLSSLPSVAATFVDSDSTDTGTLTLQICADAACSTVVDSHTSAGALSNGAQDRWTPSTLADGTYFARARSQDAVGNVSGWSSVTTFSVDRQAPVVPTLSGIDDAIHTSQLPTLGATFSNPGGSGTGDVTIQLCRSSSCATVAQSDTASGIADGATAAWKPDPLGDGTYYWRARAQDNAGNESEWSALRSFTIDTTAPSAPTVTTARARVRSAPLLTAGVTSDTVRGVIQLCADPACADVRTIGVAGRADAGIAWQAPNLPDGTYYWRAFAEDAVGNDSGWSTTANFVIDTVPPDVPTLGGPAADARVSQLNLSGALTSLEVGDTAKIAFQICTDAACASIVTTSWSADTAPGVPARWSPPGLDDGTYYWRLAAEDAAGNSSAWSDTRRLTLDTTPPAQPNALRATLSKQMLALRWKLPTSGDQVSGYALFVNGKRTRTLQVGLLAVEIPLRAHDRRTFAIAAIDTAGNVGVRSRAVAVMPQLVNLTLQQAKAETDARKLVLRWSKKTAPSTTRVVAQNQAAFSVIDVGSAVTVVVASEPAHRTKS